jgi:hypothetical protein
LRQSEVVVLPAVEREVHVDVKEIRGLVKSVAGVRPRAVLVVVLRVGTLDEAGSILAVGVEDGDVEIVNNVTEVEVDEGVEFLIAHGGHVVGELRRLRPRRASRGVHGMGDVSCWRREVWIAGELESRRPRLRS